MSRKSSTSAEDMANSSTSTKDCALSSLASICHLFLARTRHQQHLAGSAQPQTTMLLPYLLSPLLQMPASLMTQESRVVLWHPSQLICGQLHVDLFDLQSLLAHLVMSQGIRFFIARSSGCHCAHFFVPFYKTSALRSQNPWRNF